nr:hypothetical protein BaRGS_028220 [Batillaria attramentaria]
MSGEVGVSIVFEAESPVVEGSDRHVGNHAVRDRDEEGPMHASEAPIVLVAPSLRVEQLKDEDAVSSVYTSEEEGGSHVSDDGDHERSSGGDFAIPDEELRDKIIKQVEFYFSDANILKDSFLLKHVRRNKMGYVSIKLITSFKKVKTLTKDYRVVAFSLRQSEELEVNEEGTKDTGTSPVSSPLMGRRNLDGTIIPGTAPKMLDMTGVMRQPRGPDGSKGFYGGIGRGKPRSHTIT